MTEHQAAAALSATGTLTVGGRGTAAVAMTAHGTLTVGAARAVTDAVRNDGLSLSYAEQRALINMLVHSTNAQLAGSAPAPAVGPLSRFARGYADLLVLITVVATLVSVGRDFVEWVTDDNPPPTVNVQVNVDGSDSDPAEIARIVDQRLREQGVLPEPPP